MNTAINNLRLFIAGRADRFGCGRLPPRKRRKESRAAYPEGNYEVVSARCTAGSGEMLVGEAVKLLKELKNQGTLK